MKLDIKTLLKKKVLTGDEVGRIMIADLVKSYSNLLESGNTNSEGLLTDVEKNYLVNSLTSQEDIKRYNEYRYVHDYICSTPMHYVIAKQNAEIYFWKLYTFLENTIRAECDAKRKLLEPHIVTQEKYDEMKQIDFKKKMKKNYSIEDLVIYTIAYFLRQYSSGKETPFNKHFSDAKEQPIENSRIKTNYFTANKFDKNTKAISKNITSEKNINAFSTMEPITIEQIIATIQWQKEIDTQRQNIEYEEENLIDPEDATLFDALGCIDEFYSSNETGNNQTFYEIEQDFPKLYKAIWNYLTKIKSLAFIKDVPKDEFVTKKNLIPVKILYDNKFLDVKERLDVFDPSLYFDGYIGGIAIIQESGISYPNHKINQNGEYVSTNAQKYPLAIRKAETLVEHADIFTNWIEVIKDRYKDMYAIHTFLVLTSEFCKVDGLEILIEPVNEECINIINFYLRKVSQDLCYKRTGKGSIPVNKLRLKLENIFKPIKISELQPTEKDILKARESMSFKTFQGHANSFIEDIIKRGNNE